MKRIALELRAGAFTGEMRCADRVGRAVPLTGLLKPV